MPTLDAHALTDDAAGLEALKRVLRRATGQIAASPRCMLRGRRRPEVRIGPVADAERTPRAGVVLRSRS
jgi:hypothetical protein